MAFKLVPPTAKTFSFDVLDSKGDFDGLVIMRSIEDKSKWKEDDGYEYRDTFRVHFREATYAEDSSRADLIFRRVRTTKATSGDMEEVSSLTPQRIMEHDLMTLCCGIEDLEIDGIPTPKFVKSGSYQTAEDKQALLNFFRAMPIGWVEELYDALLETNPKWASKR